MFRRKKVKRVICANLSREDILFRYLVEKVEKIKEEAILVPKPMSPEERCEAFAEKYKDIELCACPLCNSKSRLHVSLRQYTQTEGFAGGYDINVKIGCTNCTCGLDPRLIYTNIRFSDEKDDDQKVEEIVSSYAQEWNTRYDDLEGAKNVLL